MHYLKDMTLDKYLKIMCKSPTKLRAAYVGRRKTLIDLRKLWKTEDGKRELMEEIANLDHIGHKKWLGL